MTRDRHVAAVRRELARYLRELVQKDYRSAGPTRVLLAVSGGADSLSLAAAAAFSQTSKEFAGRILCGAVIVDHGLQGGSDRVAARAAEQCRGLGLDPVRVVTLRLADAGGNAAATGGVEAVARRERYAALLSVAHEWQAEAVLTGHTSDDQAETVLLGLARGAGLTALRGMRAEQPLTHLVTPSVTPGAAKEADLLTPHLGRPLLGLTRADTEGACAAEDLEPWHDPMNSDLSLRRVAVRRELMPLAEQVLGPGFAAALTRTARRVNADLEALDTLADREFEARAESGPGQAVTIQINGLADIPAAIRTRLWLRAARLAGSGGELSERHVLAIDALVSHWHGQGLTNLPGRVTVWRECGKIKFHGTDGHSGA